ncbi:hypothetical protein [Methylobacterium sp. CM6247]
MAKRYRMDVDPRSNRIASALMASAMEDVAQLRIRYGVGHYEARDQVLREVSGEWVKQAGKETADAAVRGLHFLQANEYLTQRESAVLCDREKRDRAQEWERVTGKPLAWYNRLWFAWFGMALWCAVVAVGGVMVAPGTSEAREASPRWRALAACGVVSMKSPEYERSCRRFSRTEITTTRSYDGPGYGAPREWELPKAWE